MNWIENLLIVAGVSLDTFAYMECQGALVQKVDKKHLSGICALIAGCQFLALFIGHFLSDLYCRQQLIQNEAMLGELIAVVICFGLGVRLMVKAVKNEPFEERLETRLGTRRFVRMAVKSSFYTMLMGIAFGFLHTNIIHVLIMMTMLTVVFAVSGTYVGYRIGFAQKSKVYMIGALLLWAAGADVLIRSVYDMI